MNQKKNNLKINITKHAIILILIGIIAIVSVGYVAFTQNERQQNANLSVFTPTDLPTDTPLPTLTPTPTIDLSRAGEYKTYTNTQYGFQITYPAIGPGRRTIIECGNAIGPDDLGDPSDSDIDLDGFFVIHIGPQEKSLNDYVNYEIANSTLGNQNMHYDDLNSLYTIENITTANADEAIAFRNNPANTAHIGYADDDPFAFTIAIYRKNNLIIELFRRQDGGAGCSSYSFTEMSISPKEKDLFGSEQTFEDYRNKVYPAYKDWDAAKSLKFL